MECPWHNLLMCLLPGKLKNNEEKVGIYYVCVYWYRNVSESKMTIYSPKLNPEVPNDTIFIKINRIITNINTITLIHINVLIFLNKCSYKRVISVGNIPLFIRRFFTLLFLFFDAED